ncbi:MAG: InlB B-repeat-containing protein, partial [Oscillospiraceae bacterium]|nr:InlB B-repeat-containing protein [Oscillospiraceae bacterium]
MKNMKKRIISTLTALSLIISLIPMTTVSTQAATAPVIAAANLITNSLIEIDWQGTDYINGAGRSKENTTAVHNNFEVLLNGTRLNLNSSNPCWYWNNKNWTYLGVSITQNKTTLRLNTALSSAQMTAVQNGTSTLTVRITGGVTASDLNVNSTGAGAIAAASIGTPGPAADTTRVYPVKYKPYYNKQVTTNSGLVVKASEFVHERTLNLAADIVNRMLSDMPQAVLNNISSRCTIVLFGPSEHNFNVPEYRGQLLSDNYSRAEGYGGANCGASAAGVERYHTLPASEKTIYPTNYRSGYPNEFILIHEFGHGVHQPGLTTVLNTESRSIYDAARKTPEAPGASRNKWDNSYAGSAQTEYMATAATIWFDVMAETANWDGTRGPVNHRDELRQYDTPFYNYLSRIYPETRGLSPAWSTGVPNTRTAVYAPVPAEPTGRYGPSVTIKTAMSVPNNPSGSGLQTYIPFNAAANVVPDVELWWDIQTDLMRWYLEPDSNEEFFRIARKNRADYTQNAQRSDLVLMPQGGNTASGTAIVLAGRDASAQSQQWKFNAQPNGQYIITNRANPDLAITLVGNATARGTKIALGSATNATSRFWKVEGNVPLASTPNAAVVTFNANGGTVGTASATVNASTGKLSGLPTPTLAGQNFLGWFTSQTGGTQITAETYFTVDTTVYARWSGGTTAATTTTATPPATTVSTTVSTDATTTASTAA